MKKRRQPFTLGNSDREKQRFRWLLRQRPKPYPDTPLSRKNSRIKPVKRA